MSEYIAHSRLFEAQSNCSCVDGLDDRARNTKISIVILGYVCWGVQVLLESLLATEAPVTVFAVESVCWGAQVLLESLLATEASVTVFAFGVMGR